MKGLWKSLVMALAAGAMLAGCGGGGGTSTPATATGVFVDGPVQGIKYVFGSYSGLTGEGGAFTYQVGTKGKFKVGDIVIGEAIGAATLTPVDLVKTAKPALDDNAAKAEAVKIVQFLMTLDDGTKNGSINIPTTVMEAAKGKSADLLADNLQTVVSSVKSGATLVSATAADDHLTTSLASIDKAKYAGRYVAASTSADSGVDILILSDGTFKGVTANTAGEKFDVVGTVDGTGKVTGTAYLYGTTTVDVTFTGNVDQYGTMTGTASDGATFTFKRTTDLLTPFVGLYGGSFTGTTSGSWGLIILGDSKILGYAKPTGSTNQTCSGTIDATGKATMTCSGGVKVSATAVGSSVTGSWELSATEKGTLTGSKLVTTK